MTDDELIKLELIKITWDFGIQNPDNYAQLLEEMFKWVKITNGQSRPTAE